MSTAATAAGRSGSSRIVWQTGDGLSSNSIDPRGLRRRKGGSIYLIDLDIDDPEAAAARRAVRRGRFDECERLLDRQTDMNDRASYAEAIADWPGEVPFLERWASGNSANARAVLAIQRIKRAWELRGGQWRPDMKRYGAFQQALRAAREMLEASMRDPAGLVVAPWLMWCARGLGDPKLSKQAMDAVLTRQPGFRAAYSSALTTINQAWFGSCEQALEFAREHALSGQAGPGNAVLPIEAHTTTYGLLRFDDPSRKSFWQQPLIRQDVLSADELIRSRGAPGLSGVRTRHWLAYGLWQCGELARARAQFEHLGRTWNQWPWGGLRKGFNWLFNSYGRARRQCMKA